MERKEIINMLTSKMEDEVMHNINSQSSENPWIDTPLESIYVMELFNIGCEEYRGFLLNMQKVLTLSEEDIENIMKVGSNRVYNKVFDNENNSNDEDISYNKEKFYISSLFYKFCFSSEVSSLFLQRSEKGRAVAKMMSNTQLEHKSVTLSTFKAFLQKNNTTFECEDNGNFFYNSFNFRMNMERTVFGEKSTYIEILKSSIENVKNEEGLDMAFATHFIVFVRDNFPDAIFVVIYDPYIEKYALRKVYEDGVSSKIAFMSNNELDTFTDEIIKHLEKR